VRLAVALVLALAASPALARKLPRASTASLTSPQMFDAFSYQFSQTERIEVAFGKTIVSATGRGHTPWMGWFPLRVSIDNTGGPKQTVKLVFRSSSGSAGTEVTRTVDVDSGARLTVSMPIPAEARYGSLEASSPVIGRQTGQVGFTTLTLSGSFFGVSDRRLVLSFGTSDEFEAFLRQKPDNSTGEVQVLPMPLDEAPTELTAYLGFQAVFITDERGFEGLNEAQRRALEAWVSSGGTLILESPPRTQGVLPLLGPEGRVQTYGLGHVAFLEDDAIARHVGVRRSLSTVPQAKLQVAPLGQHESTRRSAGSGTGSYSALLPQALVPVGRFLFIISLFTLLIGPGSVWIARKRGPAVLLATIPATALVTCVVILGSSLLLDGFTVHGSSYGYTLLDRDRNRAITVGLTAWYANLAPRSASYDATTALIAPQRGGEPTSIDVDWSDGARYRSGFIPSRTYREWGVVSVEPTRARLVVKQKGERFVLQNALGMKVKAVWVRVGDELFVARDVRDGAEVALTPDDMVDETVLELPARQRFVESQWRPLVMAPLADGQFLASVEGAGFVPTGGVAMNLHEGKHVVRGQVER